jgi:hypothetical protein
MKRLAAIVLFCALLIPGSPAFCRDYAAPPDNSLYAGLLEKHIRQGLVDYQGLARDKAILDQYLEALSRIEPESLTPNHELAYWINAYNAWTIKLILTAYPDISSIKDLGSFLRSPWKISFVKVGERTLTLDNIEHDIIRPKFADPRIHFAINCAAVSCPPLWPVPFEGQRIDEQLDAATLAFINDPEQTYMQGDRLFVTRIFRWFAKDFNGNPQDFVLRYAKGDFAESLASNQKNIRVIYQSYDWSLNDWNRFFGH